MKARVPQLLPVEWRALAWTMEFLPLLGFCPRVPVPRGFEAKLRRIVALRPHELVMKRHPWPRIPALTLAEWEYVRVLAQRTLCDQPQEHAELVAKIDRALVVRRQEARE